MRAYLPLSDNEISLRFPQRVLRSKFEQGMSARLGLTTIRFVEPNASDGHDELRIPMDGRSHFLRCSRSAFRFSFGHGKCYRLVPRKLSGGPR
jgi:hypothetical protein